MSTTAGHTRAEKDIRDIKWSMIFRNFFMGLGGVALAIMPLIILKQNDHIAELESTGNCRYGLNVTVARIVVAAVHEDQDRVVDLGDELEQMIGACDAQDGQG